MRSNTALSKDTCKPQEPCEKENDAAKKWTGAVGKHEAEVDVDDVAIGVQHNVPVVAVLGWRQKGAENYGSEEGKKGKMVRTAVEVGSG
jgi:hypothetical protein